MQTTLRRKDAAVNAVGESDDDFIPVHSPLAVALAAPGLYLDAHTAHPLWTIKQALLNPGNADRRSLTMVDTHKKAEKVERLHRAGCRLDRIDARAFPARTKENCRKHSEVEEAQKAGFDPGIAICPNCEHRKEGCGKRGGYYHELDRAAKADHIITTLARGAANLLGLTADRDAIFVASDRAMGLFLPTLEVRGSAKELQGQLAALCDAIWFVPLSEYPFWDGLRAFAKLLSARIGELDPAQPGSGFIVPPPAEIEPPTLWAELLWAGVKQVTPRPPAALVRLVTAVALGRSGEVVIGCRDEYVELLTVGKLALPDKPIVVFAPESAKDLARATDRIVNTVGDAKPLAIPVWQACTHFTATSRAETAVSLIRGFLARPGVNSVGIIANRRVLEGTPSRPGLLKTLEPLLETAPGKIGLALWRDDVRSLRNCDLIVGLGAPTVSPSMVRARLIQTGQVEAAAQSGEWSKELKWSATTAAGVSVLIPFAGYRNKAWQDAYNRIVSTTVRRTLALISSKCITPVVMLTDQQLNGDSLLEVSVIQQASRLTNQDAKILSAIQFASSVRGGQDRGAIRSCTPFLLQDSLKYQSYIVAKMGYNSKQRPCLTTDVLAELSGLSLKLVRRRLKTLRAAGYADWNRREGWTLPTTAWLPVEDVGLPSIPSEPAPRNAKPAFDATARLLVEAIAGLVEHHGGRWSGCSTLLEMKLAHFARANRLKALTAWLATADRIGSALRRLTVELAAVGVRVTSRRSNGQRLIVLEQVTHKP